MKKSKRFYLISVLFESEVKSQGEEADSEGVELLKEINLAVLRYVRFLRSKGE